MKLLVNTSNNDSKKDKLKKNSNSNLTSKLLNFKKILNSNSINNSSQIKQKNVLKLNKNQISNNSFMNETRTKDNFIEAILDKSNIIFIDLIKMHFTIIIFFTFVIIFYSAYKLRNNTKFIKQYERFYLDFYIVEARYSALYYYWNTMKTIIIFDEKEERWNNMKVILENMNSEFEKMANDYNQLILKNMNFYNEVEKLFEIFTYNKKDSAEYLKTNLCKNESSCSNYIISKDSIFNSGIDSGYKMCFSFIHNIFMDYLSIENKTSAEEIINSITDDDKFYEFKKMKQSTANVFYFLKQRIFNNFRTEAISFGSRYKNDVLLLNIISLVISVLILLFVNIFIFITLSNYTEPIKDSVYRINHSFFYITNYNIIKSRKKKL